MKYVIAAMLLLAPGLALAHCDGLDGPVAQAARKAFDTGNVRHVLIWVQEKDEPEIKSAFERASAVRKLDGQARTLAETWFLETLVRIHRAGEGAPYTGLQPARRDLGPAIPAADRALESGSPEALLEVLTEAAHHGLDARFERALAAKKAAGESTAKGREFVRAYVEFLHYAEAVYEAAAKGGGHEH